MHETMIKRKRMEQDGLYVDSQDHWEMFETRVYIWKGIDKRTNKKKKLTKILNIPIDIIRHLKLKHKDKILVAIKRKE